MISKLGRLLAAVAVLVVLAAGGEAAYLHASGWRAVIFHTGSMTPTIVSGDLAVDRPPGRLHVGEVITFAKVPGQYTTHRIAAITPDGIRTKGDANPTDDFGYVQPDQVVGVVDRVIPDGGFVAEFLKHPDGIGGILLFVMSVWLAWGLCFPADQPGAARHTARRRRRPAHLAAPRPAEVGAES